MPETAAIASNTIATFQVSLQLDAGTTRDFNLQGTDAVSLSALTVYSENTQEHGWSQSTFNTLNSGFVNALLQASMSTGNPDVLVRYGLSGSWSPWQRHTITSFSAIPKSIGVNDGYYVRLATSDPMLRISRSRKVVARKGTISGMVAQIALENGIESTVIEPTQGTFVLVQSYESDVRFVNTRLKFRAINEKGRGNYQFFFKDGALHFHTADYQAGVFALDFFSSTPNLSLVQSDRSQLQLQEGAAKVKVIAFDPLTGATNTFVSDSTRVLKLAKTTPALESVPNAELNLLMHTGQNAELDAQHYAQARYEHEHSQLYQLALTSIKAAKIRAGDLLNLVVQASSTPSPWSGFYMVRGVRHVIDQGNMTSQLILHRGELNKPGYESTRNLDPSTIATTMASPGQDLNVMAVESSTRATGTESNTLRKILNPDGR